jgi:predicted esterase YcpF (UPF0227 family)
MKKIIVYCHGYGSNPNTDKLQQLKDAGFDAYCFHADIDPVVAFDSISREIDLVLLDYLHQDIELIFVGTSLGGWMASKLAKAYGCRAVIINPSYDPELSLEKYGIFEEIRNKYTKLTISEKFHYFFAEKDEVLDHADCLDAVVSSCSYDMIRGADHRFNEHFHLVIDYLKSI